MKNLKLLFGIALLIMTTFIIFSMFFVIEPSKENMSLMCVISVVGYLCAYILISNHIDEIVIKAYRDGWDDKESSIKKI